VPGSDRQKHPRACRNAGLGEVRSGGVALLVELPEGAGRMLGFDGRMDRDRRLGGRVIWTVGSRDPEMAGDIASRDVHGLQTKKPRNRGFCKG
jgi:hypothetical protein